MQDYRKTANWLLSSSDPSIRYFTLVDLLGNDLDSGDVVNCVEQIASGPKARSLLAGQQPDGGFGVEPYRKWIGSHWRLVSLVNLAIPPENERVRKASDEEIKWIYGNGHRKFYRNDSGNVKIHASVYGNALGVLSYLGLAEDPRVEYISRIVLDSQWPDGGWNCDANPKAWHSSFNESLSTLWGLIMYNDANGDSEVRKAINRGCELFLSHRIMFSHRSGDIINHEWLKTRYPVYWHYNFLEAMRVAAMAGKAKDPRMKEALDLLESKRGSDGFWKAEGFYWRPFPKNRKIQKGLDARLEAADWGRTGPNEMITLNALRVLKAAGRASF